MGFFGGLASTITERMAQKRQQDFAREADEHRGQLEMFSTAISAAEKAGDWEKVAQFTGLLGDYTQGGMGKKGKGKRDTALHSIADALKPVAAQMSDYKAQDTTKLQEGSEEAKAATRPRKIADLPKRTTTQGPFEAARQKQREQDIEDQERKARMALEHDERLTERAAQTQQAIAQRQEAQQRRAAEYKANGDVSKLAAAKMAADPQLSPEEARKMAGEDIKADREDKHRAVIDKHNTAVAGLSNIASLITTRADHVTIAYQNVLTNARNADTRARAEGWKERKAGIDAQVKGTMDGLAKANTELGRLIQGRAVVALAKLDPETKKPLTDEQAAARLREIDAEIDAQRKVRDEYGQHLQGYSQQYDALEQAMGAAPWPPSSIPAPPRKQAADPRIGKAFTAKDGKRYKVTGINPATGNPLVVPIE